MALNTPFYPYATTNAAGSFSVQSAGYVQGVYQDEPAIRYSLASGTLSPNATGPIWGGMAISESIAPASNYDRTLGGTIVPATAVSNITGFSVFNNAYSMVGSPSSPVPLAGNAGASVAFFRLGCGIRIPVAMDPSLVSLDGSLITTQVSWDFNNQVLQPYDASTPTYSITSQTATFSNGVWTVVVVMAAASPVGGVGDLINISGATNSGTGGNSLVNGNQTVTAFIDNQHFSYQVVAPAGAIGTIAGTQVLNYGTGALPVKILDINAGNSMTVVYNPTTGAATWNRQGYAALIQI
ncbi:hypothetical protein DM48_368 [Burkholderia gladioli]|uniref:Tail fiber protein n=1 Tax=Burkholderia gladioli TaxID=28095 RepID=A0AAW3F3E1_BURGA|nr:hypothetical protein [Burkholderia gladioli]KGC14211.1 hypothetical protein DM48_368 [Burkholderia gladioli]